MARSRSSGRSSGRSTRFPAPHHAPEHKPPQTASKAPPPAAPGQNGGGSVLGTLGGVVAEGIAFGTGSSIAHRAVDAVMGPRTILHETAASVTPATAPNVNSMSNNACIGPSKAFQECLESYGSDISKCQFYMDMLSECKRNSGVSTLSA